METVRSRYVSNLLRFSTHARTFTFAQNMPTFSSSLSPLRAASLISSTYSLHTFCCSKVASAQHSTLFHASLGMADSKQHFLPFFSHGKLLSLYNPAVWQAARPTNFSLSDSLALTSFSSLCRVSRNWAKKLNFAGWEFEPTAVVPFPSMPGRQAIWYEHMCPIFSSCRRPSAAISTFTGPS